MRIGLGLGALAVVTGLSGCAARTSDRSVSGSAEAAQSAHSSSTANLTTAPTSTPSPSSSSTSSPGPASALADGPGPRATYVVEPQPAAGSCHYSYVGADPLSDPHCTPGALNPQVSQGTLTSTICKSGYASSIRPPESVTEAEKRTSALAYGYTGAFSTGEYDHLVALELGGDPNDAANLWVEPNDNPSATTTANSKDVLEDRLHTLVCAGQVPLATAQAAIATNWVTAYHQYVGALPSSPPVGAAAAPGGSAAPAAGATCAATATPANDGYSGDYDVSVTSNQPNQKATARDAADSWSEDTDASGSVKIVLYHSSPGEQIEVTVGAASCSAVAP